jgi:hypothetical protein
MTSQPDYDNLSLLYMKEEDYMNLKEAFRYQNKLQEYMTQAKLILRKEENITETKTTVFRSKVDSQAQDEITTTVPDTEYASQINELVGFLLWLMEQREKLSKAIRRAKNGLAFDIDGEVSLNKERQDLASTFRRMIDIKNSERLLSGGGRGYRFNAEGNQVLYVCDMKRVTTITFDRTKVRNMCAELNRRADSVSNEIDQSMVNTNVDFIVPFDVNDSFDEAFNAYQGTK